MRILFVSTTFPTPAQPTLGMFNLHLLRALAREHHVKVICPIPWLAEQRKGEGAQRSRDRDIEGIAVSYPRYYYPPKILRGSYGQFLWYSIRKALVQHCLPERPDVVIGYWVHPDSEVALRAARMFGVPGVVMVGGSDVLLLARERQRRRCIRNVLHKADAVIAVGNDLKEKILELGISAEKVHVLHRGIDPARFSPGSPREARSRLGLPDEGHILLWVGRMVPVKGLDVLLQACARLRDQGQAFHLYLAGDGVLRPSLQRSATELRLRDRVSFVRPQTHDRLPDWYRAADLTVLSSLSEGIPNVLRESLACGTPVVASHVGGVPEIIAGPVNRMVPPGNPEALASALAAALAERARVGPCRYPSTSCTAAAEALLRIIHPLVATNDHWHRSGQAKGQTPAPEAPGLGMLRWCVKLLQRQLAMWLPRRLLLMRGPAASDRVCLTFDDGPHPEHTPRLLDALKEHGVRASFFVIGERAQQYPDLVRRMAAEGHTVGNHTFYHTAPDLTSVGQLLRGLAQTQDLLTGLVGRRTPLMRPPHGKLSVGKLWGLWRAGQRVVLWNRDPRDYAQNSAEEVRAWFRNNPLRGGDLVLLHDRLPYAADVLPELVSAARQQGLAFTTIEEWAQ